MRSLLIVGLAAAVALVALAVSMSERGSAAFPGANGKIAYSSGENYSSRSIWTANSDGSMPTMLTHGSSDYGPTYSANGSRIAFERENGVAVMNADGSGATQLLSGDSSHSSEVEWKSNYEAPGGKTLQFAKIETAINTWHRFGEPSFSPDGTQLAVVKGAEDFKAFVTCAVGEEEGKVCLDYDDPEAYFHVEVECIDCMSQILTVSSATGAVTGEITPAKNNSYSWGPAYSATAKIAFSRTPESEGGSRIFVVDSPGATPVQVTNGFNDREPDFSPDGSRIVFVHASSEVGLVGVGGGPVTILPVPIPPKGFNSLVSPAFSPDGSKIVFERAIYPNGDPASGIYTMATDGSGLTRLLSGSEPSWQPVPAPPPPPPPVVLPKSRVKHKVTLGKNGTAVVGTITCGSSPCTDKPLSALLKVHLSSSHDKKSHGQGSSASRTGRKPSTKTYKVRVSVAKTLAPGAKAEVKVSVRGKALGALRKAGKGALAVKVGVTDAHGKKVLAFKPTLKPPKAGKRGKRR